MYPNDPDQKVDVKFADLYCEHNLKSSTTDELGGWCLKRRVGP